VLTSSFSHWWALARLSSRSLFPPFCLVRNIDKTVAFLLFCDWSRTQRKLKSLFTHWLYSLIYVWIQVWDFEGNNCGVWWFREGIQAPLMTLPVWSDGNHFLVDETAFGCSENSWKKLYGGECNARSLWVISSGFIHSWIGAR
jgi:hypothetical protein